jgi:hypothetical protein
MNKSSSQLSQVVGPQTIRHSVSIDKLNSFGPTDSTGRKAEHINLIIRDTHNQKEKESMESEKHLGKDGARSKEWTTPEPIALQGDSVEKRGPVSQCFPFSHSWLSLHPVSTLFSGKSLLKLLGRKPGSVSTIYSSSVLRVP